MSDRPKVAAHHSERTGYGFNPADYPQVRIDPVLYGAEADAVWNYTAGNYDQTVLKGHYYADDEVWVNLAELKRFRREHCLGPSLVGHAPQLSDAPELVEGTTICRYCRYVPEECVCG